MLGRSACLCAVAALASAASIQQHDLADVPAYLVSAFNFDGFNVISSYTYNGQWGLVAESRNSTVGSTGMFKRAYYVEGSGYEMGYLRGYIAENETNIMTSTYLDHIVPSLIDEELDILLQNSSYAPVYDILIGALADLLINDAVESFTTSLEAGAFPQSLVDEMMGMTDGAKAKNLLTTVTFSKILTLNYGYDYLLALIYSGNILNVLATKLAASGAKAEYVDFVRNLPPRMLKPPMFCDAFAARGAATKAGNGSIFARDFQFALALVFQDIQAPTIHVPSDGRRPLVNVGGPGFVGAMTAMNDAGFAMGVDVLQAGFANWTVPGINSLLLVRATAHVANTSEEATQFVALQQRGVSWLYPMSDASGDGRVLETGPTVWNDTILPDYRAVIEDQTLWSLLPTPQYLAQHIEPFLDFRMGVFVRNMSSHLPLTATIIPTYNPGLYARASLTYPNTSVWLPGGSVWPTWDQEETTFNSIAYHYFSPEHIARNDIIAVSNLAIVPHMRIAGMSFWSSLEEMGAPQWRYDSLVNLVTQAAGTIDLPAARELITFLSPQRTPGFNGELVGGVIAACDLQAKVLSTKGGYWVDDFVTLTLPNYLAQ